MRNFGRDFLIVLGVIFIFLGILVDPLFLWMALIMMVLLIGSDFHKG